MFTCVLITPLSLTRRRAIREQLIKPIEDSIIIKRGRQSLAWPVVKSGSGLVINSYTIIMSDNLCAKTCAIITHAGEFGEGHQSLIAFLVTFSHNIIWRCQLRKIFVE